MMQFSLLPLLSKITNIFGAKRKTLANNLLCFISCLWDAQSVSIYACADRLKRFSKTEAAFKPHYQRFIRFFRESSASGMLANVSAVIADSIETPDHLIMDRTNWKRGKHNYNVLVIGVLTKGIFIPVVWKWLDKRGNSSSLECIELLERFVEVMRRANKPIADCLLLADREFIGMDWISALNAHNMNYCLRVRKNFFVKHNGEARRISSFRTRGKDRSFSIEIDEMKLLLGVSQYKNRNGKTEKLYVYTNNKELNLSYYRLRYKIECCFKHLKSNGFDLEACNLRKEERVDLLFAACILAFVFACLEGIAINNRKAIKYKEYANGKRYLEKSIFRTGLTHIVQQLEAIFKLAKILNTRKLELNV